MKLTKSQLKQIIKEELGNILDKQNQGMEEFVQEEFVELSDYDQGMSMDDFDFALEKFEVKYNLDFPDSVFKLYDVFEDINEDGLANRLRAMYEADFEDREFRRAEGLEEAYSEKQRKWACAQMGKSRKKFKGKPSLSSKEATEMCKDTDLKKAKKKRK